MSSGASRSWLAVGAGVGLAVAVVVPPAALAAGIGMGTAALVRHRRDGLYYLAIGFGGSVVVYAILAVLSLLAGGSSSGSGGA